MTEEVGHSWPLLFKKAGVRSWLLHDRSICYDWTKFQFRFKTWCPLSKIQVFKWVHLLRSISVDLSRHLSSTIPHWHTLPPAKGPTFQGRSTMPWPLFPQGNKFVGLLLSNPSPHHTVITHINFCYLCSQAHNQEGENSSSLIEATWPTDCSEASMNLCYLLWLHEQPGSLIALI